MGNTDNTYIYIYIYNIYLYMYCNVLKETTKIKAHKNTNNKIK